MLLSRLAHLSSMAICLATGSIALFWQPQATQ